LHLALFGAGRFADALAPMQEALRLFDEIAQLDPRDGIAIGDLASAHSSMQAALTELGRDDEAFEHAARALELAERRVQIDEHDLAARSVFAIACFRFGVRLLERDDEAGGIERLRRAREQFELVAEASPDNADAQSNCAIAECDIGMTLAERAGVELGMWEEARADLAAGVARFRGLDARGALGPDGRDSLETYEQALRDCEERLSELRGASSDARR
jgi:tetratricopeptide (TPR) repeat protein